MVILTVVKRIVSLLGVFVILWGAVVGIKCFIKECQKKVKRTDALDEMRLRFGRTIVLGLEFIVAADVIDTTMAPDYYSVGILASLVAIRTLLTFFMNQELNHLSERK